MKRKPNRHSKGLDHKKEEADKCDQMSPFETKETKH